MKYIHADCLRTWLKSKITTKSFKFLIVHSFKNVKCEICKAPIPGNYTYYPCIFIIFIDKVRINGDVVNLLELQRPDENFIMLESITKEKTENKYIYIIHLKDKLEIKLV